MVRVCRPKPLDVGSRAGFDRGRQQLKRRRARFACAATRPPRKRFRGAGSTCAESPPILRRVRLYDHIEERVGQPVQAKTRDELRTFLADNGFDDTTVRQIDHSLEAFDFARFAPTAAGPGEMRAQLRQLKELLEKIEKVRLATARSEGAA